MTFHQTINNSAATDQNVSQDSRLYRKPPANNLIDKDYANFAYSFITPEIIEAATLRRVGDIEGAEIVGRKPRDGVRFDGVIFPYFVPGDDHPREYRLRRDHADKEEKPDGSIKEKAKYLSSPGARNMLYFPPAVALAALDDAKLPLVVVEGEKKLLAMHRLALLSSDNEKQKFLPVGLSGVWNFRGTIGKTKNEGVTQPIKGVIPDFQFLNLKNRKVIVLFDANVRTNPDVNAARFQLAKVLKERGAKAYFAELPEECEVKGLNGVDDYLGAIEREKGAEKAVIRGLALIDSAYKPKRETAPQSANFELISDGSREPGVYFIADTGERLFVCSALEILAETQTEIGENYGRLLRWADSKDRVHSWAVPMPLLHGEGNEVAKRLVSEGLELMPSKWHREKLSYYIATSKPDKTIVCTDKIGWHGGVYVLPDKTFGGNTDVVLQTETGYHKYNVSGSLTDWQKYVSKYCIGNSRLAFVVSTAFACALLPIVDIPGGGFHFRGTSSTGKTTALHIGGSVFGGSDEESSYCQTWKATANGLESVAASHNHALLCLDEIGECDPRQVGDIAYMLANGHGKQRMTKTVMMRKPLTWRLLFISTGETRLSDKMREAGQTIKGGQEVRLCDIEADTGYFGLFEYLHEFADGQSFSDYLRSAAKEYYGTPIREFLQKFIYLNVEDVRKLWHDFHKSFIEKVLPPSKKYPSEVYRVATRFALVACAGEMATKFGVTAWQQGEATRSVEMIFRAWLSGRSGTGATDAERAISQIRAFIEAHGSSRFETLSANEDSLDLNKVINRAGFRKQNEDGEIEFLFLPEIFRSEVCKGFDYKFVCKILAEREFLNHSPAGYQKQLKYGGTQIRPYWISSRILSDVEETNEEKS